MLPPRRNVKTGKALNTTTNRRANTTTTTTTSALLNETLGGACTQKDEAQLRVNAFLQTLYSEALVDEAIETTRRDDDRRLTELAARLQADRAVLDATEDRLRDVTRLVQQYSQIRHEEDTLKSFLATPGLQEAQDSLATLADRGARYCDRLHVKNVHFGHDKRAGFAELSGALAEATAVLDGIFASLDDGDQVDTCVGLAERLERYTSKEVRVGRDVQEVVDAQSKLSRDTVEETSMLLGQLDVGALDVVLPALNNQTH